jgi:hypothetical protein
MMAEIISGDFILKIFTKKYRAIELKLDNRYRKDLSTNTIAILHIDTFSPRVWFEFRSLISRSVHLHPRRGDRDLKESNVLWIG